MKFDSFYRPLLAACLLLAAMPMAHAQQWYQVELVVFENLSPISSESSPAMPLQDAAPLTVDTRSSRIQPASREQLTAVAERLRRSAGYRVHSHQAWQQPILAPRQAQAVAVTSDNNRISGQVRLRRSTYLHVDLDLWLLENTAGSSWGQAAGPEGISFAGPSNPNLKESRRIRSGQLHYFDHPRMGALLKLTPVDAPEAAFQGMQTPESYSLPAEDSASANQ